MTDVTKLKGIREETRFMHERAFNVALLEVFVGERTGSLQEQEAIRTFQKKLGNKIYVECVYLLTHKLINQEKEAKQVFKEILHHQREICAMPLTRENRARITSQAPSMASTARAVPSSEIGSSSSCSYHVMR